MATDIWASLGFKGNPYESTPLSPVEADYELFVGRQNLGVQFRTQIEGGKGCIAVLSGNVGVGKTSFFNIQQYLLFSGESAIGPKLVPALSLTPLIAEDVNVAALTRRITHNTISSIQRFCKDQGIPVPPQVKKVSSWLASQGKVLGNLDLSLSILDEDGSALLTFEPPAVHEASLEVWKDVLGAVASDVKYVMGYDGVFVALDNAENLDNDQLAALCMTLRDTLFLTDYVWWVLIGQPGLYGLLAAADKRVSQRTQGSGVEVTPLTAAELHEAVERRVRRYRSKADAVSPISAAVHQKLFDASRGEIRYVLKTSDDLVRQMVSEIRTEAEQKARAMTSATGIESGKTRTAILALFKQTFEALFFSQLSADLIEGRFPDVRVEATLKKLVLDEIRSLGLKKRELEVLAQIGNGEARSSDHERFKLKTMQDFSSNYLTKMFRQNLLHRRQAGTSVYYRLRGSAALAFEYGLFVELIGVAAR